MMPLLAQTRNSVLLLSIPKFTHTHTHTHTHAHTHTNIYTQVYSCMSTHTHIYLQEINLLHKTFVFGSNVPEDLGR